MIEPTASPDGKPATMNTAEILQWVDACNHEPARDALRELLALRQGIERLTRERDAAKPYIVRAQRAEVALHNIYVRFDPGDPKTFDELIRAVDWVRDECSRFHKDAGPAPEVTYYTEGKDAVWFEGLDDAEFAKRASYAAMDIADGDFECIEKYMPVAGILSDAAKRINRHREVAEASLRLATQRREEPDIALIEATARKINPGRSEDHIKSVAMDALSIFRTLALQPKEN